MGNILGISGCTTCEGGFLSLIEKNLVKFLLYHRNSQNICGQVGGCETKNSISEDRYKGQSPYRKQWLITGYIPDADTP